jgi:hypothetical protein
MPQYMPIPVMSGGGGSPSISITVAGPAATPSAAPAKGQPSDLDYSLLSDGWWTDEVIDGVADGTTKAMGADDDNSSFSTTTKVLLGVLAAGVAWWGYKTFVASKKVRRNGRRKKACRNASVDLAERLARRGTVTTAAAASMPGTRKQAAFVTTAAPVASTGATSRLAEAPEFSRGTPAEVKLRAGKAAGEEYGDVVSARAVQSGSIDLLRAQVSKDKDPYRWGFKRGMEDALFRRGILIKRTGRPVEVTGKVHRGAFVMDDASVYEEPVDFRVLQVEPGQQAGTKGALSRQSITKMTFRKNKRRR